MPYIDQITRGGTTYEVQDSATKAAAEAIPTMIAYEELTTTATHAYTAGNSYFILGGLLYMATADIAIGDPIVTTGAGANCEAVPGGLGGQVADLKSALNLVVEKRIGINLYDEAHNGYIRPDPAYTDAVVYLYGYTGDIVVSTKGQGMSGYLSNPKAKDANGNVLANAWASGTKYNSDLTRSGKLITLPQGTVTFEFSYRTSASSGTLVQEVMVTKGDNITNLLSYEPYTEYEYFKISNEQMTEIYNYAYSDCAYLSPTGDDNNDGLTHETPVKTFARAFEINRRIKADRGTYYEGGLTIENVDGIYIMPYDNNDEYSAGQKREKITVLGGTEINKESLSQDETIYSCTISGGYLFNEVFINHSIDPIIDSSTEKYRANVHVIYDDISKKCKLKPVLSFALCEAETNTFYWDGTNIYCNISDGGFSKIAIVNEYRLFRFVNCNNMHIEDVAFKYSYNMGLEIKESNNVSLYGCETSYCSVSSGYTVERANIIFNECYATHNGQDGFNYHWYGTTILNDCISEYNYDDGCSHHEGCTGSINGGRFTGNGKCGIAPAYGANVNIYNAVCDDNPIGIGYLSTGTSKADGIISSCALIGNQYGLSVNALCNVKAINTVFANNTNNKLVAGNLTEYNSVYDTP